MNHMDTFDTRRYIRYAVYWWVVTCHATYICNWREPLTSESHIVYTRVPVDCGETFSKKELLISGRYVAEYHKSSKVLLLCVDTTYWPEFFSPTLSSFAHLYFMMPLKSLKPHHKSSFLNLHHWIIWAPSSSVWFSCFFLALFSPHSQIYHLFHQINVSYNQY